MVYILLKVVDFGFRLANAKKGSVKALIHKDIFNLAKCLLNCKWVCLQRLMQMSKVNVSTNISEKGRLAFYYLNSKLYENNEGVDLYSKFCQSHCLLEIWAQCTIFYSAFRENIPGILV